MTADYEDDPELRIHHIFSMIDADLEELRVLCADGTHDKELAGILAEAERHAAESKAALLEKYERFMAQREEGHLRMIAIMNKQNRWKQFPE
jgi:hypothetical protein